MQLIKKQDEKLYQAMQSELQRQTENLELIASENFVSPAVLEAAGSVLTNKYAEGYPYRWSKKTGKLNYKLYGRYYGGCEYVDEVEELAIERAKELFGAEHANVQPHSGSQANMAVYFALVKPGDTVLSLELSHGGHLTHGHPLSFSGALYNIVSYGVDPKTEQFDYEEIRKLAEKTQKSLAEIEIIINTLSQSTTESVEGIHKQSEEITKISENMIHVKEVTEINQKMTFEIESVAKGLTAISKEISDGLSDIKYIGKGADFSKKRKKKKKEETEKENNN